MDDMQLKRLLPLPRPKPTIGGSAPCRTPHHWWQCPVPRAPPVAVPRVARHGLHCHGQWADKGLPFRREHSLLTLYSYCIPQVHHISLSLAKVMRRPAAAGDRGSGGKSKATTREMLAAFALGKPLPAPLMLATPPDAAGTMPVMEVVVCHNMMEVVVCHNISAATVNCASSLS